jgi:hypothetical protein
MKKSLFLSLLIVLSLISCTRRFTDFTIISTKNIDLSNGASFERARNRVEGRDRIHIVLFIPTGVPNMKEAIDRAIESTPGCIALLDGVVYSKYWWIPYIYGQSSFIVEGTPLIDPKLACNVENESPLYGKVILNGNGEVKETEPLSHGEYLALKSRVLKSSKSERFSHSKDF